MADIDIDPFGEHESGTEEPTDEYISLTPVGRLAPSPTRYVKNCGKMLKLLKI